MSDKVYIFDEITVSEGEGARMRKAYLDDYAPSARKRGMTLEGAWRSPPVELEDRAVTLHFLWSVADVGAWWAMRLGAARADPSQDVPLASNADKLRWWQWVDNIAISRKRTFMRDLEETSDV
jgi:hypothetical protein